MNIINKIENVNSGSVAIRNAATIGYLNQQPEIAYNEKIVRDILYDNLSEILDLEKTLKKYETKMQENPDDISIINKYLNAQERFMNMGGYEINALILKVSDGLNITDLLDK